MLSIRRFSLFPISISPSNPGKVRSALLTTAFTVALAAYVLVPAIGSTSYASPNQAPPKQAGTPFLTLPFASTPSMSILSGWYYSGSGGFHGGIDYINGNVNSGGTWKTFPVIASADGEACGNCSSRQGNAVWVKHKVSGATYYTYYGHLASIAGSIPLGSQSRTVSVKRGQVLGMAGDTGASGALHLHFALYTSSSQPMDPYGINKLRQYYPSPAQGSPGIGWFITDQPQSEPVAPPPAQPTQQPTAQPTAQPTTQPTAYPTPVNHTIVDLLTDYGSK